jgi:alkylated DNA repair dioxygenase AlkB
MGGGGEMGEPWLADLKRRVQHYGYRYDYKSRKVDPSMYLGALPIWSQPLIDRLMAAGYMDTKPDQLIVNEYEPGQGITAHVDCVPCFGPVVCSITLGSACMMELSAVAGPAIELLFLEQGSLLILADDARYKWRHAIPGRKNDRVDGQVIRRGRRVSLTFRTVRDLRRNRVPVSMGD